MIKFLVFIYKMRTPHTKIWTIYIVFDDDEKLHKDPIHGGGESRMTFQWLSASSWQTDFKVLPTTQEDDIWWLSDEDQSFVILGSTWPLDNLTLITAGLQKVRGLKNGTYWTG